MIEKTIEELENEYWPDQKEYPTGLIERCHNYRKIKIKDLQIHQIITLLIQDIGSDYLMPIVLDRIDKNVLEEDDYDGSSFIESFDFFNREIFKRNRSLHLEILSLLERKKEQIENKIGWKEYDRIYSKITEHNKG